VSEGQVDGASVAPESDPKTPPTPEGFGRYLTQQRELRGLSLQAVADQTKLSLGALKALEAADYARLPERVFIIGAVRAYARCVGLSAEETVLRLQEALGPEEVEEISVFRRRKGSRRHPLATPVVPVVVALLLICAAWAAWHFHAR